MATDFFDRQDDARRQTGRLVAYFVLAVIMIILAVYAAATGVQIAAHRKSPGAAPPIFDPARLLVVACGTGFVIGLGSLFKTLALREGGAPVARSLGGRLVDGNTSDPAERRLLNIVEEMALASGTPVPPVYLLDDEPGINAFAAGYAPSDAVIGVTRGAVAHLNRDQLQGVIAHEFSHVLNGDMRLDLKILGTVHGILLLAILGEILMRIAGNSGSSSRSERDGDKKDNGAFAFFLMGLALYVIGYLGVFFGRLIKSAVSRQREFLADASAVQFTRNPEGIAGALKKIGGLSEGGRIKSPAAEEACHMFFGAAVPTMTQLMATHPPLIERVKRLDPQFNGEFPEVPEGEHIDVAGPSTSPAKPDRGIGGLGSVLPGVKVPGGLGGAILLPAAGAVGTVGAPKPEHVAYASALIADLPAPLSDAAREPFGAAALIYAMLLDEAPDVRGRQIEHLKVQAAPGMAAEADRLSHVLNAIGAEARLPLVDLALPALRSLSADQYDRFRRNIDPLVKADDRVSLFEFALNRVLLRHLDRQFLRTPPPKVRHAALAPLADRLASLLGSLAWIGQQEPESVRSAFDAGASRLGAGVAIGLPAQDACSLDVVDSALGELAAASPQVKRRVLEACAATIGADGRITVEEGELLRAIADSLDCPMPPLLA